MEKFEFKSAICTTKEQSERLLKLGLKKETADMVWIKELAYDEKNHYTYDAETYMLRPLEYLGGESHRGHLPAWSLHRLMEIMYDGDMFGFVGLTLHNRNIDTVYDLAITNIEELIKIDKFNKDYLDRD